MTESQGSIPTSQQYSLGGGSLGSNVLQGSIDRLNTSVTNLSTTMSSLVSSIQGMSGDGASLAGRATRQQNSGFSGGFPKMINPFQSQMQQQGIGGGGSGGSGNISPINTFRSGAGSYGVLGSAASAVLGFAGANTSTLINLNQYATSSMIGANSGRLSRAQAMQQMYAQAGMGGGGYLNYGLGAADSLNAMATLQQRAGSQYINQTALGRSALGYAGMFGTMNPGLGATSSANIAAAMLSPTFSLNMMSMGYKPILGQGGASQGAAQAAMSMLAAMNLQGKNASSVFGNLSSGVGQANLSYLFGSSGISNAAASQYLTGVANLSVNQHMSATKINQLFNQASYGNPSQRKAALATLNKAGITTAGNDLSSLQSNQSVINNRMGSYASGFDKGLQQAAGLLTQFNQALSAIMAGPLGSMLGYGGGLGGTLAGASSGLGILSSASMLRAASSMRAASAASTGASGASAAAAGGGGMLAELLGPAAAGALAGAIIKGLSDRAAPAGTAAGKINNSIQGNIAGTGNPIADLGSGWIARASQWAGTQNWSKDITSWFHLGGIGGGAAAPTGSQTTAQNRGSVTGGSGVSSSAIRAVGAAESQLGVPYQYGAELPGVGFDCSALVQWAYKQAGVSLPRTSQQQWSALSKRSIALNAVQEGDLVFTAGADGSFGSPGHVGLMISHNKLIQAPHTGADVEIIGYDPGQWQHAARPSGSGSFSSGGTPSVSTGSGSSMFAGNRGTGGGVGGTYGSVNEVDIISAMGGAGGLRGGITNGSSGSGALNGTSGSANTNTSISASSRQPTAGSTEALAQQMALKWGWSGSAWQAIKNVEGREDASWSLTARNPSGAYGIAQFINGPSEYYQYGGNPNTAAGQITGFYNYIKQRYHNSPAAAWAHELADNWYAAGGTTLPGLAVVGERGPELMMTGGGQKVFSNAQTMQLINAIRGSSPAQSPWQTDITSGSGRTSSGMSGSPINVTFNQGSIVLNNTGTSSSIASSAGSEVARQIIKHINKEATNSAIRSGEKM